MLLFLKKKPDDAVSPAAAAQEEQMTPHEFLPYYCHYNPNTLLTKNGELMQIIRIVSNHYGLNYESGTSTHNTVREVIREAITESVVSDKFALWIHTLRKRKPIRYTSQFDEPFAAYIHDRWQKKHRWKYQYYNEVYITILRDGQSAPLLDKKRMQNVVLPLSNRQYRRAYLEESQAELDETVARILDKIRVHYDANCLSVVERISDIPALAGQSIFYSEPMEFLGTLLNQAVETFPLPDYDISEALCTSTITFGFNALSVRHANGGRRFGAILSLKQYREVSSETVDRVLQSSTELVITESFTFLPNALALAQFKTQTEMFAMSEDGYSIRATGIEDMLESDRGSPVDYGEHQVSVTVLVDEFKQLDPEVGKAQEAFAELGLITVREDIRLEECFWAQMPGNFEFLRRREPINTSKIAGFARLNLFPNGISTGNHWGEAAMLLPTQVNSPYFFNFHYQDNGHTVLFDYNSFHDSAGQVLLNFLLASALKYRERLFLFDRNHTAQLMFNKLGGGYHTFPTSQMPAKQSAAALNPFSLDDTPRNRGFLLAWCLSLAGIKSPAADEFKPHLTAAIDTLYTMPPESRTLDALLPLLTACPLLAKALAEFGHQGKQSGRFNAPVETLDLSAIAGRLHGFDMDPIAGGTASTVPLFSYLLHRIINTLDGKPAMIVLHEAWDLLENEFFAPRLESLLEMLTQNNVMVIFTTQSPQDRIGTATLATLMKTCATRLYVPDDIAFNYISEPLGLQEHDAKFLRKMERQKGDFLLQQGHESIALAANLEGLDDIRAILGNDIKNLIAAGGRFASIPQDR